MKKHLQAVSVFFIFKTHVLEINFETWWILGEKLIAE